MENVKGSHTRGNKDDIRSAVKGLDIFTKNWCMSCAETEEIGEPSFKCEICEFQKENENCSIKEFANNHDHDYPMKNFGAMGQL